MLQSTINDYSYYNSEEEDAESDPKSDQLVATHISDGNKRKVTYTDNTNGNSPQNLLINQIIPKIVSVVILPIPQIADGVAASTGAFHGRRTILSE